MFIIWALHCTQVFSRINFKRLQQMIAHHNQHETDHCDRLHTVSVIAQTDPSTTSYSVKSQEHLLHGASNNTQTRTRGRRKKPVQDHKRVRHRSSMAHISNISSKPPNAHVKRSRVIYNSTCSCIGVSASDSSC